ICIEGAGWVGSAEVVWTSVRNLVRHDRWQVSRPAECRPWRVTMTSIKMLGLLGLLGGLALGLVTDAPGHERPPKRLLGTLTIFGKKDVYGDVVCGGDDRFVALHFRKGKAIYLHNFKISADDMLVVDDKYLGYDLRGKNKNVLVRERSGKDTDFEFVRSEVKS